LQVVPTQLARLLSEKKIKRVESLSSHCKKEKEKKRKGLEKEICLDQ
jgi:hypothetical protein